MNENQRLAYLDALGIDSYISRRQLPAAAPSRRVRRVRPLAAATPAGRPVQELLSSVAGSPPARGPESTRPAAALAAPTIAVDPAVQSGKEPLPMFSVVACYLAGYYWLDEIPRGREAGDSYLQLLMSICHALGWEAGTPLLERFDWPMHHNRQLDQGQATARDGFSGFMRARLERYPVRGVILLGEAEGGWLDPSIFSGVEVCSTVSAWRMLKQPELKIIAWRELQRLSQVKA